MSLPSFEPWKIAGLPCTKCKQPTQSSIGDKKICRGRRVSVPVETIFAQAPASAAGPGRVNRWFQTEFVYVFPSKETCG
jgi:hypothetical protein